MMHAIMTIMLILETKVYTANADVPNLVPRFLSYPGNEVDTYPRPGRYS